MKPTNYKTADEILILYEHLEPMKASTSWEQQLFTEISSTQSSFANKRAFLQYSMPLIALLMLNTFLFFRAQQQAGIEQRTEILSSVSNQLLINSTPVK